MEPISIYLKEDRGIIRTRELSRTGVPFPRGSVHEVSQLQLTDSADQTPVVMQARPMAYWPDGSIRWACLGFLSDMLQGDSRTLSLSLAESPVPSHSSPGIQVTDNSLTLEFDATHIRLDHHSLSWQNTRSGDNGAPTHFDVILKDSDSQACQALLDSRWAISETGPVFTTVSATGQWQQTNDEGNCGLARFTCNMTFFSDGDTVEAELCIHNPRRARHKGGLWDLGDPGSIHFRSLCIKATFPETLSPWVNETPLKGTHQPRTGESLCLYQDSSGGENWQSRNHIDANGQITTQFRGFQVRSNESVLQQGLRASPVIGLSGNHKAIQASMRQFWQNFPSALSANAHQLNVALFPDEGGQLFELQGGERKTQTAYFHTGKQEHALDWTQFPIVPTLAAEHYEKTEAFPWFKANAPKTALDDLIQQGLDGPNNFFEKREQIDEYGWRNFGDLFADHETLYQKPGETPFISHYNNQYDAIYGFAHQFALTGDRRWFELMDDLARHVSDIDIYHTEEDRAEYNNGLFWHTDHYLDAHTATHRTFSRYNDTSSTPGQTGGGPAEEHCYTTGLLYHYYLKGDFSSRAAVLDLSHWIYRQREGQKSLLGQLDIVRRRDWPQIRNLLKGKSVANRQYGFTRGTGNYLNTLLDAHLLEPENNWLAQAEQVIRATVHPDDNVEDRNLLNVETKWSYLVFLSSLSRYLTVKLELNETDTAFQYALASFRSYADWIRDSEKPFLKNPEELEFPNDTWTAQDFRKTALLYQAAAYFNEEQAPFHDSAGHWKNEIVNRLNASPERHYTRIIVILLQNYGPQNFETEGFSRLHRDMPLSSISYPVHNHPVNAHFGPVIIRALRRLKTGLKNFSFKKEKKWFSLRLEQ